MSKNYKFKLKEIPYPIDGLEPYIDAATIDLHHNKHHQSYVDNLNKALDNYPEYQDWSLEKLLTDINELPDKLRIEVEKHGGGVHNHDVYFAGMSIGNNEPKGKLLEAINEEFGSIDEFKDKLKKAAAGIFGSGYAFLVKDKDNKLSIIQTSNQHSPLSFGLTPIIALDVWEHSYYLKFQNKRADYIDNFIKVINWDAALDRYLA